MADAVNSPPHYQHLPGIEVIDITEHLNFCLGNVIKYVLRADHKGRPLEDLRKAAWYLDREIARREAEAPRMSQLVADIARANDLSEDQVGRLLAKALNNPVTEPLAKTGPRHNNNGELSRSVCSACSDAFWECTGCGTYFCACRRECDPCPGGADILAPYFARHDDQHVRGEE